MYRIRNTKTHELWTNANGWGLGEYDSFTELERDTLNLPLDGAWEFDYGAQRKQMQAERERVEKEFAAHLATHDYLAEREHLTINIDARRWFDRNAGNTYHSVQVSVNGEHIGGVNFAYGYDEQYLQTALTVLQKAGIFPKTGLHYPSGASVDYMYFMDAKRDKKRTFYVTCSDVGRKKDLHNGGKD